VVPVTASQVYANAPRVTPVQLASALSALTIATDTVYVKPKNN